MLRFLEAVIGKVLAGNIQLESEHRDISSFRSPTSTGKAHSSTQWKDVNSTSQRIIQRNPKILQKELKSKIKKKHKRGGFLGSEWPRPTT
ncbi:unnamed protein product [Caretta caretta]